MKTVMEMAGEVLDRMAPDHHCHAPYWTATDEELERLVDLARADEREANAALCDQLANDSRELRFAAAIRSRSKT